MKHLLGVSILAAVTAAALAADPAPPTTATAPATIPAKASFPLREYSTFDDDIPPVLRNGQMVSCTPRVDSTIKKYPALHSAKPLYGTVKFGADEKDVGNAYSFVIDSTAAKPAASKPADVELAQNPPPQHYDLLYLDLNRDGDLTNDTPVKLPRRRARQTQEQRLGRQ